MPTFIEVCAGAGGLSSGLINVGFTPILLNDNNKDCCETLKKNHSKYKNIVIHSDMKNLNLDEYKNVDLLAGGIPCQSYSQSGKREGLNDPRGQLLFIFINYIKILNPKAFLIENVKGMTTHNKGETLKKILSLFDNEKYNIVHKVLNAFDYSVPQKRERLFIIGTLKHLPTFKFPQPHPKKILLKDILIDVPKSPCAKYTKKKIDLFEIIPQGGCWINLPEDKQKEYLGNSYNSGGGKRGILRRLSMNEPCLTLLCSPAQKQTERCHPLEERPLNIREYARIQTFPDEYEFVGSLSSCYKQIGNAVPVKLAECLGIELQCIQESNPDTIDLTKLTISSTTSSNINLNNL